MYGAIAMSRDKVLITVTYGNIGEANILNLVYLIMAELKKLNIEPILYQVYQPGSRLRLAVNGVEIDTNGDIIEEAVSTALETLSVSNFVENKQLLIGYIAASKTYQR